MSPTTLFRLSGFALLTALPLQVLGFLLHPPSEQVAAILQPTYGPAHLILFVSWLLAMLGLVGLYTRQAERAGGLGVVGFVLTVFAAAYHFYLLLYETYATTQLARDEATQHLIGDGPMAHGAGALGPLGFALILAFPLFGVATLRAGLFPRWSGWLQIASLPVMVLGMLLMPPDGPAPLGTMATTPIAWLYIILFLGYAWAGYDLWADAARTRPLPTPAGVPQPAP